MPSEADLLWEQIKGKVARMIERGPTQRTAVLIDRDRDTQVQVEESADEDKIRMDTGGTERVVLDSSAWSLDTVPVELTEISTPSNPSQNSARLFMEAEGSSIVFYMLTATGQKVEIQRGLDAIPTAPKGLLLLGVKRT